MVVTLGVDATLRTSGHGLWSQSSSQVRVRRIENIVSEFDETFGEMRVFFDTNDWNVDKQGLIYTDPGFLNELRQLLVELGFTSDAVEYVTYSEQGMQGSCFVSLDIENQFIVELLEMSQQAHPT